MKLLRNFFISSTYLTDLTYVKGCKFCKQKFKSKLIQKNFHFDKYKKGLNKNIIKIIENRRNSNSL